MANERWFAQLESRIFTLVSYRVKKALKDQYPSIKCTMEGESTSKPYFPTWYFHELQPAETGQDLTNNTVNAVIETIEIVVYAKARDDAKNIMTETIYQMKQIGFNITMMPVPLSDGNVYSSTARFRRIVGAGDTDLVAQ